MPDILSPKHFSEDARKEIKELQDQGREVRSHELAAMLKDDINLIGEGGGTIAVALETDEQKVAAISFKEVTPRTAKQVYYTHKILSTLFPETFPRIYAATGRVDQTRSVSSTIRERVFGVHPKKSEKLKKFEVVVATLKRLGIPINFDTTKRNFLKTPTGKEMYIDTVTFSDWKPEHEKMIMEYMDAQTMTEEEKGVVQRALRRLLELQSNENNDGGT